MLQGAYYRVVNGVEPASYTWTWSGDGRNAAAGMAAYSGVNTGAPIAGSSGRASRSNIITAPSITTVTNAVVIGAFSFRDEVTITLPGAEIFRWGTQSTDNGSSSSNSTIRVGDERWPAGGATGIRVATATASYNNVGQLGGLRPAP